MADQRHRELEASGSFHWRQHVGRYISTAKPEWHICSDYRNPVVACLPPSSFSPRIPSIKDLESESLLYWKDTASVFSYQGNQCTAGYTSFNGLDGHSCTGQKIVPSLTSKGAKHVYRRILSDRWTHNICCLCIASYGQTQLPAELHSSSGSNFLRHWKFWDKMWS